MSAHSEPRSPQTRPSLRAPLVGGGLLLLAVAAVIAPSPFGEAPRLAATAGDVVQSRDLVFADTPAGTIEARDAGTGALVAVLDVGTNGFVRGTLRALSRERRQEELAREIPFRVTIWRDGRTTLKDMATGREIGLDAFGGTNAAAFSRMLTGEAS